MLDWLASARYHSHGQRYVRLVATSFGPYRNDSHPVSHQPGKIKEAAVIPFPHYFRSVETSNVPVIIDPNLQGKITVRSVNRQADSMPIGIPSP